VREAIRIRHYSIRSEEAHVHWVKAFIRFYGVRHPREMGAREVTTFLSHLATGHNVAVATQDDLVRPKKPARLPTVLNQEVVARLLDAVR